MPQRRLLAGAQGMLVKKARRAVAAQVRRECAIAGAAQVRHDTVPRPRVIGKSVQEDDWGAALRSGHLAGDIKRSRAHPYNCGLMAHDSSRGL
jgi:hypothetical protein